MRRASQRTISLFTSLCLVALTVVGIVAATAISASAAPPASDASFEGLRLNGDDLDPLNWGDDATPTPVIAVGPDQVVQVVNDTIAVFSKSGSLIDATDLPTFWEDSPAGTCITNDTNNYEANDVFYDSATDRWIVLTTSSNGSEVAPYTYNVCIAASKTGNPDGDYYYYSVPIITSRDLYLEPGATNYGLWINDGLWMTTQLGCDACPFRGTANDDVEDAVGNRVWAFNTADLESGSELRWATSVGTGNQSGQTFPGQTGTTSGIFADVIIPATYNKASGIPPAGRNEFIAGIDYNATRNDVWRVDVNWATSAISFTAATATQLTNAYNANYDGSFNSWVTEPTPGNVLDTGYDYDIGRIVYSNTAGTERLWATHGSWTNGSAPASGFSAVQWDSWVVAASNATAPSTTGGQFQNFCGSATSGAATANCTSPDSIHRWLGSIGVDRQGNMALNYNVTSPSLNVGMRYTGRLFGDPSNNVQAGDQTLVAGSGYQVGTVDGDPFTSFGGQTLSTIDPDGCTFWTTGEYFSSSPALPTNYDTDTWNTRIGAWHWSGCTPTALATSLTTSGAGPAGGVADLKATLTATGTGSGAVGKTINFTLGGNPVGSAVTNDNGVATLPGVDISAYSAGTNAGQVGASFAGTTAFGTSSNTGDLLASGATAQTITFANPGTKTFGDANFDPGATSDSSLTVTYTAGGDCSIAGGNVHIKQGGSCTVTAHQGGDATYAPADDVARTFAIAKANQVITFAAPAGPTAIATGVNTPTAPTGQVYESATSSSKLPVVFGTNANCALTGLDHVYGTHAGSCTVTASQPGSASYNAATPVPQTTTIGQSAQTASLSGMSPSRIDQADHQLTPTWTSGAPSSTTVAGNSGPFTVTASSGTGTVATLTTAASFIQVGTHVTITGAGAYNATNVPVTAVSGTNTLTFSYASAATGTGGVGGSVAQSLTVCSASGNDVTVLHTGACAITVTQNGNADYLPGGPTTLVRGISKGNFGTTTFSPAGGVGNPKPANAPINVTATLHASAVIADPEITPSLNAGTLSTTTPSICSVGSTTTGAATSSATVTPITSGVCTISASGTTGNDDWNARTAQSVSYTIVKANQTITITGSWATDAHNNGDTFTASATAPGGAVTFSSTTPSVCTVTGDQVSVIAAGTCTVRASQGGNAMYNPAPDLDTSMSIGAGGQTITFNAIPNHVADDPDFNVSATASSGLDVSFTAAGKCTVGATPNTASVHLTGGGMCTITAHQPGDDDFSAAPDVARTFQIAYVTKTTMTLAPKTVASGGSVTATVKVGVPGVKNVYGANLSVQVMLNDTVLGTGMTNNKGVVKITFTAALAKGTYKLVAVTTGNATYGSSMSAAKKTPLKVT